MKYAVMAALILATPAQRDSLTNAIQTRIGNKPTWGQANIGKGLDEESRPQVSLNVRFDSEADMNDVFSFIKGRMDAIPVLQGQVSKHPCSHAEQPVPCAIEEKYEK